MKIRTVMLCLALSSLATSASQQPPATLAQRDGRGGITKIAISSRMPAFGGQSFGAAGPYEQIRGLAFGEIDPTDPRPLTTWSRDVSCCPTTPFGS